MDLIQALILGVVQGVTEWLPISSTAHLRVVPALLGWEDPGAAFTAVIQLGTLAAMLIYFREDLWRALRGLLGLKAGSKKSKAEDVRLGWAIVMGTVPIVVCGLLFQRQIEGEWRSLTVIAWTLIGMGLVMAIAEWFGPKVRAMEDVTPLRGLWIGLWQALALVPGMSRSGSTISGGLFAGFDRPTAARLSFLLCVPSILAAGLKELYDERAHLLGVGLAPTLVATLVSFVVGYASIAWLMRFLQKHSTLVFVIYRVLLGGTILYLLSKGSLVAQ